MSEKFNLTFECENCKKQFPVSVDEAPNSITHKKEFEVNGQSIFLTYYDCPHCGNRHFVQIDDEYSLKSLKEISGQFRKFIMLRKKGKKISKKQSDNFTKARYDLSKYRTKLMKEFTGKSITDVAGISYTLRFSVWE